MEHITDRDYLFENERELICDHILTQIIADDRLENDLINWYQEYLEKTDNHRAVLSFAELHNWYDFEYLPDLKAQQQYDELKRQED